jgi:hypothetical protein
VKSCLYFVIYDSIIATCTINQKYVIKIKLRTNAKTAFFLSGVEVLGVKVSTGGSTESNVRSFEVFVTIYLSITRNI